MATPLYKRYMPPKSSAVAVRPPEPVQKPTPNPSSNGEPKKRKRERTEQEVAERKAKKLRKKGIDPTTIPNQTLPDATRIVNAAEYGEKSMPLPDEPELASNYKATGEFGHVKSSKKRHKLEKEARKARKAAGRDSKEESTSNSKAQDEPAAEVEGRSARKGHATEMSRMSQSVPSEGHTIAKSSQHTQNQGSPDNDELVNESKKKRKDKKSEDKANGQDANAIQTPSEQGYDQTLSQPKKRRHKLEHVFEQAEDERNDEPNDDREHLQKHKGILKKFQRATELSKNAPQETATSTEQSNNSAPVILDLAPLPQPEQPAPTEFKLDPASLPTWLTEPHVISSESKLSFAAMELDSKLVERLSGFGFDGALPVQQALIPLLLAPGSAGARFLPGSETVLPDIAVSAPTGSGKTIGYLLPIIESLKKTANSGKLKALVVVPTRELVVQVAAVAESLAKSSGIKIAMASGTGNFKDEQAKLIQSGRRYDPDGYRELISKAHRRNYPPSEESDEFEQYLKELENEDGREEKHINDAIACLIDHVPTYNSAIDILVATPGRLLEHIGGTLGFSLGHLEWLTLDEADKLLDQQYDGFLDAINKELSRPRAIEEQDARERYLRSQKAWDEHAERRVRKVVLSATMTRDVSKLVGLKLSQPQMVVVRGKEKDTATLMNGGDAVDHDATEGAKASDSVFEVPPTLIEYSVHVGDGTEKPLFLVELLKTRILTEAHESALRAPRLDSGSADADSDAVDTSSSDFDSEDDSDSESSLTDSSASSEEDSDDDAVSHGKKNLHSQAMEQRVETEMAIHPDRAAMLDRLNLRQRAPAAVPTVLIFTSSTESANRLSHLLRNVQPEWASWVSTMTRTDGKSKPQLNSNPDEPAIVISTDRAGRGLDTIGSRSITHVLQYDVPRSVTNYVHRVGRTARAGKHGEAWTLFTHSEARWFINSVVKAKDIKRTEPVEKVKIVVEDDELRERLQSVVADMREEVLAGGRRSR